MLEIALLLVGAILGGVASWIVTHLYYVKSTSDLLQLQNKLSEEVRSAILEDQRENLSIVELRQLIMDKALDRSIPDPLPFVACPQCGSSDLVRRILDWNIVKRDEKGNPTGEVVMRPKKDVLCRSCSWSQGEPAAPDEGLSWRDE